MQRKFLGPHAALAKLHEMFASRGEARAFEKKCLLRFSERLAEAFLAHGQIDLGAGAVASKLTSRRGGRPVFLPVLSSVCVRLCVEEKVLLASKTQEREEPGRGLGNFEKAAAKDSQWAQFENLRPYAALNLLFAAEAWTRWGLSPGPPAC